jgi:hypothetical protein
MYSIDFIKLIDNLLPWFLRKPVMKAWLQSLSITVADLYDQFILFADAKRWEVSITGQVALLEIMLNKEFYDDAELRDIFIEDNDLEERIYLFNLLEEQEPVYLYNLAEEEDPVFITNSDEREGTDFTIWVPSSLVFDINYMTGLVTKYKMSGPIFDIKTYGR